MSTIERQNRAIRRASIYGGAKLATPIGDDRYRVVGRCGDIYTVYVQGWSFRCDCQAGLKECACWHAAATFLRRVAESITLVETPAATDPKAERRAQADAFLALLA